MENQTNILVIGSGLAGLVCALSLAPRPVTVLTKTSVLAGGSSLLAQGGISAAIGPDDSPQAHATDTISAGAGLSDSRSVQKLTHEAEQGVQWLLRQGVPFDLSATGKLSLSREAAHRAARVVHAGGDATGKVLIQTIVNRVLQTPSIRVLTGTFVDDLITDNGNVAGVLAFSAARGWHTHKAPHVVLATGGIGSLWLHTTNPCGATGDGLAVAARAGAEMADLEFVQFHPTVLASGNGQASMPLLTEALRGAGATLIDETGRRFLQDEHAAAELAPRDIVAREIYRRASKGHSVFLDLRPIFAAGSSHWFPQAMAIARQHGFDPACEALPVTPAAHYHMGGVTTDDNGRTSVTGLWACGEVATTGVHGANRLASNSLLEALIYARRVAADIPEDNGAEKHLRTSTPTDLIKSRRVDSRALLLIRHAARSQMSHHVGILRSGTGLKLACRSLLELQEQSASEARPRGSERLWGETRNSLLVARLIATAALRREESRGAHYRDDFPSPRDHWHRRQSVTIASLEQPDRNTHAA